MKRKIRILAVISGVIAILSGCNQESNINNVSNQAPNKPLPLVVATSSVICDLTKQIAAETINLKCLIEAGTDPHTYKTTPDDIKAIANSKLVLYSGYNFEPTLIRAIKADTGTAGKVAVAEVAVPKPILAKSEEVDDKATGKLEPDPHVWHNAQNGIKMVEEIAFELKTIAPEQVQLYEKNSKKTVTEILAIDRWIKTQIATIPANQRRLVTTHDALGYYVQAYNIPLEGALQGISTEEKATPTRIKDLVNTIKSSRVPTIFAESSINPKLIQTLSKESQVNISNQPLFTDGLGAEGSNANTYQTMLIANTKAIVEGLGGKFTPIQ
ncbi:metal ABC transporter solute-binding protein, Zn/Mn family [Synechococcus sp. PCC 7502]|uniref:metal ABC transporter solute-binding protein, Zn/Mn family n=1 Tax=Synechococcus sp. PCC 7502 TaxID=1173263 RepID=UPI001FEDB720|nr:zinc ABC transporter substrate-binding protein [Synechococcus sp. PCC 7502]